MLAGDAVHLAAQRACDAGILPCALRAGTENAVPGAKVTPRVESLELTESDCIVWFDVHRRLGRQGNYLWTRSLRQDTRDADVMYGYLCLRLESTEPGDMEGYPWVLSGLGD